VRRARIASISSRSVRTGSAKSVVTTPTEFAVVGIQTGRFGEGYVINTDMDRAAAIAKLKEHEAELKGLGVEHLYLFGSMARDEAGPESDVDLFFDYEKGKFGLFQLMDVKERAANILGRKVDIMTRDSLHKVLRDRIEAAAVLVF
jgi:predicted nucleotidyltransferase